MGEQEKEKMIPKKNKLELKILGMLPVDDMVLITGKLITGDVYGIGKDVPDFRCIETGGRWEWVGLGFDSPKGQEEGIRLIGIEHSEGSKDLQLGFTLVIEEI